MMFFSFCFQRVSLNSWRKWHQPSLLRFNYPPLACLVFKSSAHFTFMNATRLLAQWARSGNTHGLKIWMCKSDQLANSAHNMAASLAGGAGKKTWENYKKLYDIMMQPPVGVQPRDAFRDTEVLLFPINQTEVRCSRFYIRSADAAEPEPGRGFCSFQSTSCKSCVFYFTDDHLKKSVVLFTSAELVSRHI